MESTGQFISHNRTDHNEAIFHLTVEAAIEQDLWTEEEQQDTPFDGFLEYHPTRWSVQYAGVLLEEPTSKFMLTTQFNPPISLTGEPVENIPSELVL